MKSNKRIAGAVVVGLALTGSTMGAESGGAATKPAAPVQVGGTLIVRFFLTTALPDGSSVSASVQASPEDTTYEDSSSTSVNGTVSGGRATLTATVPYSWRVSSTSDKVQVYGNAGGSSGTTISNYNSTTYSIIITLPANGATSTLNDVGTL